MTQLNRTGTAPLRPLTGPLPGLPPQAGAAPEATGPKRHTDTLEVAVGDLGLEVKPKPIAEVAIPSAGGFFSRAQNVLAGALAATSKVVKTAASAAADSQFIRRVAPMFSEAGTAVLEQLSAVGKLSAVDAQQRTLRGVIANALRVGGSLKVIEAINNQTLHPDSIEQIAGKTTCPTAVYQKALAEGNPGAYARVAHDLWNTGKATLPDGTELSISEANRKWIEAQNFPTAKKINALFQVALAEAVVKPDVYDVASDTVLIQGQLDALSVEATPPVNAQSAAPKAAAVASFSFGPFSLIRMATDKLRKRLEERREQREAGGLDFYKVVKFFRKQATPLFDPRAYKRASEPQRADALKKAFEEARREGKNLALPVHADVGSNVRYHLVQIVGRDEKGNYTVHAPQTGEQKVYSEKELLALIGWKIRPGDNVGGGRVRKSGGDGTGDV